MARVSARRAAKFFEQRDGERGAFLRGRTRAHFVHEDQGTIRGDIEHGFQVQHVRGKGGEIGGDGLLVANVGEHAVEDGHFGALGGNGNGGLRGERGQADRFERHRFAAGVRAADDQDGFRAAKGERQRHGFAALRAQRRFEHGIARCIEPERIARGKFGDGAIEFAARSARGRKSNQSARWMQWRLPGDPGRRATRSVSSARMRAISPASSSLN